jgi:hypothetical protein
LTDLDKNVYRRHVTDGDSDVAIFNPTASTTLKWLAFKLLRWMQSITRHIDLEFLEDVDKKTAFQSPYNYILPR